MDMEKFYTEWIPRSCLPADYGGELETIAEMHKKHCEEFKRLRPYFLAEEKQAYLELDKCDKTNLESELIRESERNFKNISID
jgi:hypothetical protein